MSVTGLRNIRNGLYAEIVKTAGDFGIQWLTDLCSDLIREASIASDSVLLVNEILWIVVHTEGSSCRNML